ncbi:hypothetical protein TRFO_22379 [Tritrichomonas foetus]|uniref:DM10 domain-containing protein n=1 Tax=Tritrichomonas foetus TaxID=1144522 RepID=A0A1J4KBV8_9EUKA|nr:hypothetical protein TRFO_22379 [Tritrichomonas foetus]|eukprot:OHT08895.1 hypothetical protein TRFO_22379 [Tritrichomonas foetus]
MDLRPPATVLQFTASLVTRDKNDKQREFVIAYYVEDRAFAISERLIPNSGFRGGKFMQKTVVNNPKSGKPYDPSEIFIGAVIEIAGRQFCLQEASEDALKVMEARSDVFTKCDLALIMNQLREKLHGKCPQLLVQFQQRDTRKTQRVSLLDTEDILAKNGIVLGDQEFLTLFRRFQYIDSDKFKYQEFIENLV